MSRILVIGDIHGQEKKLKQVLERAKVNDEDVVISLGDIVDRGEEPFQCMRILHDLKHVILIQGNHDECFQEYTKGGKNPLDGHHGSYQTMDLYNNLDEPNKQFVKQFLHEQRPYYVDRFNNLYVHGGFDINYPVKDQSIHTLCWDRSLWEDALELANKHKDYKIQTMEKFNKIFIGHTPTTYYDETKPMYALGIWNIDTGSGKGGKLTIMDVQTEKYWQSD